MRWLILAVALSGCSGVAYYQLAPDDSWGLRRLHDYEMCGGDTATAEKADACMAAKGYAKTYP